MDILYFSIDEYENIKKLIPSMRKDLFRLYKEKPGLEVKPHPEYSEDYCIVEVSGSNENFGLMVECYILGYLAK